MSFFISTFAMCLIKKYPIMNTEQNYKESIASLLPDHSSDNENFDYSETPLDREQQAYESKQQKYNAATLAKMKLAERQRLNSLNGKVPKTEEEVQRIEDEKKLAEQNLAELDVIESSPEAQNFLAGECHSDLSPYAGTTKRDVVKLLDSL